MNLAPFTGKRVLITGGLGFIGSNLAARLLELGAEITLVDSLVPEYGGNMFNIEPIKHRVRVNISDVRDTHSFRYLIKDQDYLFNLAGQTSHLDSMTDPLTDLEINCRAQLSILEDCRHHNPGVRIVFASTRQLYGKPEYLPVDERHPKQPVDVNGVNKMAGEWYHILYHNVYGLRTCVLRLTNTYGPRMRVRDARQTFLGVWIKALVTNQPFEVWGGDQKRDFTYIDDAVEALLLSVSCDQTAGKVYNLGGCEVVTLKELAGLLTQCRPGQCNFTEFPAERKGIDIGDYYADFSAISRDLKWKPQVALPQGLDQTVRYYESCLPNYL